MPEVLQSFIDPRVLGQIGDLSLLARTVVNGFVHGLHRSLRAGLSLDFAEHRPYQPGDDLRRVDWRVYGRTDRFYLKTYEADTNADVIFALDASASMDFGSGSVTKFDYARFLTASLAWLAQRQGDRVGLVTIAGDILDIVPPSTRHLQLAAAHPGASEGERCGADTGDDGTCRATARPLGHGGAGVRLLRGADGVAACAGGNAGAR